MFLAVGAFLCFLQPIRCLELLFTAKDPQTLVSNAQAPCSLCLYGSPTFWSFVCAMSELSAGGLLA